MKSGRRRTPLALLLLASILACEAASLNDVSQNKVRKVPATEELTDAAIGSRAAPVGTERAPVDGKDGMPHDGPWVQTEADRKKQKLKDVDDDEKVIINTRTSSTSSTDIPQSNDGVMDDRNRKSPQEGTRGTEGGVSEKSKDGQLVEKKPEQPKEALPLPHSEKEKMKSVDDNDETVILDDGTKKPYAVPTDLPAKSHDIPYPENPSSPKDTTIMPGTPKASPSGPIDSTHEPAVISPIHSLVLSFTMIMFSEIGDKTFLVAALMAMRHDRIVVFTAAYSALITMTVLSAVLGHAVPSLISPHITNFLAAALFLVFGVRMLIEARKISPDEGVSEEMKEVEMELEEKEHAAQRRARRRSSISPYVLESGRAPRSKHTTPGRTLPSPPSSPPSSGSRSPSPSRPALLSNLNSALEGLTNLFSLLLSPAWVQTFIMTFLGEWGDRSQIATIAMAAGQDYWWVTAGALGGHAICTGMAVLGGKAIAGRVSLRTVTMGGAIAFLVFGGIYLVEALY